MKGELEKRQSEVIAAMRFPLMVLLLFAHVLPMVSVPIEMNLSEMNIYHFISEGISHNLSRIRNPLFFFFSGFFFFRKLEEWNAGFYRSQLKKRIRSLLLPYLLWNILLLPGIFCSGTLQPTIPCGFYAIYFVCPYWPLCSICFSGF